MKIVFLKKRGVRVILLTWWESTLESHFFFIVKFIKKQWLDFGIVTNGSTIYTESFLDKLDDLGIRFIYLSIHWFWNVHNKIVWDKNSYNKIISIIKNLDTKRHVRLFLNYVVIKENVYCIEDTLKDLSSLWYQGLNIKFSILEPEWIWRNEKLMIEPIISSRIIKKCIDDFDNINVFWDWFPLCLFRDKLEKRADLQTENIKYITEIYENKIFSTDYWNRSFLKDCDGCGLKKNCYGIYDYYINFFSKEKLISI